MIPPNRCDGRAHDPLPGHNIRSIKSATEPRLEHRVVYLLFTKLEQGQHGHNLEECDRELVPLNDIEDARCMFDNLFLRNHL